MTVSPFPRFFHSLCGSGACGAAAFRVARHSRAAAPLPHSKPPLVLRCMGARAYFGALFAGVVNVITELGFADFWLPWARRCRDRRAATTCLAPTVPLLLGRRPSSERMRFSAAATAFLPGSVILLPLQFSAQLLQPGMQSRGRATIGAPVAGSQSKTFAGQKLRHSRSRRHPWQLMVGYQGNRSLGLRGFGTAFSPSYSEPHRFPKRGGQWRLSLGCTRSPIFSASRSRITSFVALRMSTASKWSGSKPVLQKSF